jgi:hypothetical protein
MIFLITSISHLHLYSVSSWEHIAYDTPILDRDKYIPLTDEDIIHGKLSSDSTIIGHHELSDIYEVGGSLKLWDSHRESHEKSILVVDTSIVLEEHRDTIVLMDDRLRVETSHQVERNMLIDYMRTHHFDNSRDLGDLLEEHSDHP